MSIDLNLIREYTVNDKKNELTEFERKRAEKEIQKVKNQINKYKQ